MLQKACGKFEFLSNKCSEKGVLLHSIVQAICFRNPVESMNSCQTIVRPKRRIFPYYCTGIEQTILKRIDCSSKQLVKHLTARIEDFV
jgi:hypothetical protein